MTEKDWPTEKICYHAKQIADIMHTEFNIKKRKANKIIDLIQDKIVEMLK